MKASERKITEIIGKMKTWGIFDTLTDNEQDSIREDLKQLVKETIADCNNQIQNILPDFYKSIK